MIGAQDGVVFSALSPTRRRFVVSVVALPGDGTGDFRQQAKVVAATAKSAISRTHATSVDVVGYSAGGVVARLWVPDYGGASLARRVVTLGSPQHGAGDETPAGPKFVSIWTTDDTVVTPPDSASLAGAVDFSMQSVCAGVRLAHGDLPESPTVIAAVRLELATTPVVPLGPVGCERLSS